MRNTMNEIETFRKQLIEKNPDASTKSKQEQVAEDLIVAHEALDRITDTLEDLINETGCKECLTYLAQMRGEMCLHFNAIGDVMIDYGEGIEPH